MNEEGEKSLKFFINFKYKYEYVIHDIASLENNYNNLLTNLLIHHVILKKIIYIVKFTNMETIFSINLFRLERYLSYPILNHGNRDIVVNCEACY